MKMQCLDCDGNRIEAEYIVMRDPDYLDYKLYKRVSDGVYQLKRICNDYAEATERIVILSEREE